MKKLLVLSVFLALLLTSVVAAEITTTDIDSSVVQGEEFEGTITITNTGDFVNFTSITITDLTGPDTISSGDISLTLTPAGNDAEGTMTLTVPEDQALGTYTADITVEYEGDNVSGNVVASVSLEVLTNNNAPVFNSNPETIAVVGVPYTYVPVVNDADGDTLTFNGEVTPTGMTVDTATGQVDWTPTAPGSFDVNISVTDGEATTYQVWTIVASNSNPSFTFSDLDLGGPNQERGGTLTGTFVVTNQGPDTITGLTAATTGLSSIYNAVFTFSSTTLVASGTVTVNYELDVPLSEDAGRKDIGDITISGNAGTGVAVTKNIFLEAENNLIIEDIDVIIDGDSENVDDGDEVEGKPGDDVEIEITIENTFTKSQDVEIEDVEIDLDSDNELDWDDSDDLGDLKEDDKDSLVFNFDIDLNIDDEDGPFEVEVVVEGTDENGAVHGETITFDVDIDKERDEYTITDIEFRPSTVSCDERNVRIEVSVSNTGRDDQNNGIIEIESSDLNYYTTIRNVALDEGRDTSREVSVPLPSDIREGEYFFLVNAYTSTNDRDLSDVEGATLNVLPCGQSTTTTTPTTSSGSSSNNNDDEPTVIEVVSPPVTTGQVVGTATGRPASFGAGSTTYLVLLGIVILLLIVLIIIVAAKSFKN